MSALGAPTIAIFGPRSGVGKTVFATNFAAAIQAISRKKTLLVDLDLHDMGDVSVLLGLQPEKPITDLSSVAHKLTPDLLSSVLAQHRSGFHLLAGARNPRETDQLQADSVESVLQTARQAFDYLVVDCGSTIDARTMKVFESSSLILFCLVPEILTLNRSLFSLQEFQSLAFPSDLIQLVINRYDPKGVINDVMIEQKLRRPPLALLPDSPKDVQTSVNQGIPLFISDPKTPYSKIMDELARAVLHEGLLQQAPSFRLKEPEKKDDHKIDHKDPSSRHQKSLELDRIADLRLRVHQRLIELMDFRQLAPDELVKQDQKSIAELRSKTQDTIAQILDQMPEIQSRDERQRISKEVLDEALGLGPLEDLLAEEDISEILVNRKDLIYVEKRGRLERVEARFSSDKHLLGVIERIVAPVGRRIDEKTPMVDARLGDGSRVHAIIPPLALDGPMLTIRKFSKDILGPEELIKMGTLTKEMAEFVRACVEAKLNIIISGGTGTGKTTLLNVLSSYIPDSERIITVEDAAELRLPQEHVGRLEARPPNLQGEGAIPIRELVRNTLRMRPDRIVVGECRGAEALDMLQAMNTGHDGSMTTIHANSPRDAISRLETLVMFSGLDLPSRAIREQVASAIQVVIQLSRMSDGTRKITRITEITGLEGSDVNLQNIFVFRQRGLDEDGNVKGNYAATGLIPTFADLFTQKGIKLPKGIFSGKRS